jgi:hypothetical protein
MQVITMVSVMAFLILALSLFLQVTPRDRRRAGNGESRLYRRSDSHRPAPSKS